MKQKKVRCAVGGEKLGPKDSRYHLVLFKDVISGKNLKKKTERRLKHLVLCHKHALEMYDFMCCFEPEEVD